MSSGPSMSCIQPASAGAIRESAVTRSVRTFGVGVLLDDKRSRGVPDKKQERSITGLDLVEEACGLAGDLKEARAEVSIMSAAVVIDWTRERSMAVR